jgi:hypothetical protein
MGFDDFIDKQPNEAWIDFWTEQDVKLIAGGKKYSTLEQYVENIMIIWKEPERNRGR